MKPSQSDPVIDEIREVRHRISERCEHDPSRLVAYYLDMQGRYRDHLFISTKPPEILDQSGLLRETK